MMPRDHFSRSIQMALDLSYVVLRIDETERTGLVGRHNNLVLSLQIGDETIDCLRLGRGYPSS
jgi:hypothetical protein